MQQALNDLEESGILSADQATLLQRIYRKELLSVHWELRLLLYAGIMILITGLGLLVAKHLAGIGHLALLGAIALGCAAAFALCLRRGGGFSRHQLTTPNAAYDYLLLLGCLLLGTFQGYLELRFQVLAEGWRWWLLASGLFYLLCAHYFDNRLVLSLGLSTLAAWLGLETSLRTLGGWNSALQVNALGYGLTLLVAGYLQARFDWKRHFLPIHLHLGFNLSLTALLFGTGRHSDGLFYFAGLLTICAASLFYAQRAREFVFLLYAVLYGYLGATIFILARNRWSFEGYLLYFLVSAAALVTALVLFHRRFRSAE